MKKITLVSLILCVSVFLLTACASLSTYTDRLASIDKTEGAYTVDDFAQGIEEYAEKYSLNADDYSIIESVKAVNNEKGAKIAIIATWSEGKAEKLAGDLEKVAADLSSGELTYEAVQDGRFVLIGTEPALADALGK